MLRSAADPLPALPAATAAAEEVTLESMPQLPSYMRRTYQLTSDLELTKMLAEEECVRTTRLDGHVGMKPHELGACKRSDTAVRFDCFKNPEFWLEVDLATGSADGHVPTSLLVETAGIKHWRLGKFIVKQLAERSFRFEYSTCPAFWLELAF